MSEIPDGLRYTTEHEYLKPSDDPDAFYVGVTDYAQGELGDVVYLELPEPGESFEAMDAFGVIEAVKAVSDLYLPRGRRGPGGERGVGPGPGASQQRPPTARGGWSC